MRLLCALLWLCIVFVAFFFVGFETNVPPAMDFEVRESKILVGVFTIASHYEQRMLLRAHYHRHHSSVGEEQNAAVVVMFVISGQSRARVMREQAEHGDMLEVDCAENTNEGKTFYYFKAALERFPGYVYYVKADDDTVIHVGRLFWLLMTFAGKEDYVGKTNENKDFWPQRYWEKMSFYRYRVMGWLLTSFSFAYGPVYALSGRAVQRWVQLDPPKKKLVLYGDEDVLTGYYIHGVLGMQPKHVENIYYEYEEVGLWNGTFSRHTVVAVHHCRRADQIKEVSSLLL